MLFFENGSSTPFTFGTGLTLQGTGPVMFTQNQSSKFGAKMIVSGAQSAFTGGFQVTGDARREAFLEVKGADRLGSGAASVIGIGGRIAYGWGAQTPVSGLAAGVTAGDGGVIDLDGTLGASKDRFIIQSKGILRGSSSQLGGINRVSSFSAVPTGPEAVLNAGAIIASTTNTTSATLSGLGTSSDLLFGLGMDFNNAAFTISVGDSTPWRGFANDGNTGSTNDVVRKLQAGTITLNTGGGTFDELEFRSQGRAYSNYGGTPGSWNGGYAYQPLVLGNNATKPTFTKVGAGDVAARVYGELDLDAADVGATFSKYIVSERGVLLTSRTNAINGKDVELEGGVLAIDPGRRGNTGSMSDSVGTLSVALQSRIYAAKKTTGSPVTLSIGTLTRTGNALALISNATSGQLGSDEQIVLPAAAKRGKLLDPYLVSTGNLLTLDGSNRVIAVTYDAGWGDGNVVSVSGAVAGPVSADSIRVTGSLSGSGTINLGILPDSSQAARAEILSTVNGGVNIPHDVNASTSELIFVQDTGTTRSTTFQGNVTAAGLTKGGNSIAILSGSTNNISGNATVWDGSLRIAGGSGLNDSVIVTVGGDGMFDLQDVSGNTETVSGLRGVGAVSIATGKTLKTSALKAGDVNGSAAGTLSVNPAGSAKLQLADNATVDLNLGTASDLVTFASAGDWLALGANLTLAIHTDDGFDYGQTYTFLHNVTTTGLAFSSVTGLDGSHDAVITHAGNDYQVSFNVIPEPAGLGAAWLLGLLALRRRRTLA